MKQKGTILFLSRLYHPHIGGVEKHVETVSRLLVNKGYKVVIITEQFDKNLPLGEILHGVHVRRIPVSQKVFIKKFYVWKWIVSNIQLFIKSDFVHIHDVFYWLYPILPIFFFKKVYMTFHGYEGYPVKVRWIAQRKIAETLSSGSICVGDFMKKWYFANPKSVIYGGVSLPVKKYIPKQQSAVFFGRLDDQTGVLKYIEAYALIKKKYPNFELTIIGEGYLKGIIPKGIEILPFSLEIEKHIAKSRFIFVSRYLSMLEALAQQKEVVSTYNTPIMHDYLFMSPFKDYVFIAKDAHEIADYVILSLKNVLLHEKRREIGHTWAKKQSWENITGVYLSLWSEGMVKVKF